MKWESIMQQLHSGLHIFHSQYLPAEPRLATVDVDFACYKRKEMQIKGNFPFSLGQITWIKIQPEILHYRLSYMAYLTY